jgi:hypothetical protein
MAYADDKCGLFADRPIGRGPARLRSCCPRTGPYNRVGDRMIVAAKGGWDMLARGFGVLVGYILACVAFAVVIVAFVFTPAELVSMPTDAAASRLSMAGAHVLLSATQVGIIAAPLALVAALVAEWRGIRGWQYYALVAIAVAVAGFLAQYVSELQGQPTIVNSYALTAFLSGGVAAGTVYWLVAGRKAGTTRVRPASTTDAGEA